MRKLLTAGFAFALTLVAANAFAQIKLAVVEPERIMDESKEGKRIQAQLKSYHDQKQGEITAKEAELKALDEKAKDPKLADDKKEELGNQFKQKYYEYQAFAKASQEDMEGRQNKALQDLQAKVSAVVSKYAASKGLSMVLVKRMCLYNADALDITSEIIAEMDKAYPGQ